jgi:hypothetical protein
MSSDEEMGYGSIEPTPKVESTTRRRGVAVVAVVAALALFGLVVWVRSGRSGVVLKGKLENQQADKPSPRSVALSSKTVTALIKRFGHSHKPHLCEDGSYSPDCHGFTEPPTDAPTPKPVVEIVDEAEPGFFGRLFGGGSSASTNLMALFKKLLTDDQNDNENLDNASTVGVPMGPLVDRTAVGQEYQPNFQAGMRTF